MSIIQDQQLDECLVEISNDEIPLVIQSDEKVDQLSNIEPEKRNNIDLYLVYLLLFLSESSRGIVLPTISLYVISVGGNTSFLGIIISGFSLGRFLSTIIQVIYQLFHLKEFLLGVGAGTLSVVRSYIAEITTVKERTKFVAITGAVQYLGFAITPSIGSTLAYIPPFNIGVFPINPITSPGWLLFIELYWESLKHWVHPFILYSMMILTIQVDTFLVRLDVLEWSYCLVLDTSLKEDLMTFTFSLLLTASIGKNSQVIESLELLV
ncbi:hypothetical protein DFA_09420 [Cavenderia fasciculata]|uniref:Major facilitator superfamily (MFS) profile domain-containing protein n=1 Tax=Cavenderia fasciculata TaxID=261658 RepID=F4Q7K7_CACFS|nr:uncharacterized protein DFA_09420 [Cavenderia fasciculata]EGG16389.1 hypothetical protein DFA_09420 [Cavenderia fasciculata]|eukprot:XP_004354773.1 hypothetical protein DFA_09420 [Cavenderia fasciculata]